MKQMALLKQEIGRKGETPALGEKYDRLANQIHKVSRQLAGPTRASPLKLQRLLSTSALRTRLLLPTILLHGQIRLGTL